VLFFGHSRINLFRWKKIIRLKAHTIYGTIFALWRLFSRKSAIGKVQLMGEQDFLAQAFFFFEWIRSLKSFLRMWYNAITDLIN